MKKIRFFLFVLLFVFQAYFAVSKSMSFQIIQRDSPERDVREAALIIEDGLFDYFFSKGLVISNSPTVISENEKNDRYFLSRAEKEADLGGINYFLEVVIKFEASTSVASSDGFVGYIENLEWKLIDLKTEKKLGGGKMVPPKTSQVKNETAGLRNFVNKFLENVSKCL